MIKALVFDLDDTLYPESAFVESGYRAIARHLVPDDPRREDRLYRKMVAVWREAGRAAVLPAILRLRAASGMNIDALVSIYRGHTPSIRLPEEYPELLCSLRKQYLLGVVTDGLPEVQRRKVRALGLEEKLDAVVYSWDFGPERQKPHPLPFQVILGRLGVSSQEAVFAGDNPAKDGQGARNAGMRYVRVLPRDRHDVAERGHTAPEVAVAGNLLALPGILTALERGSPVEGASFSPQDSAALHPSASEFHLLAAAGTAVREAGKGTQEAFS